MEELSSLEAAVYSLLQRFVDRQSIVQEALRDLRPDFFIRIELIRNPSVQAEWTKEQWQAFIREQARKPGRGFWGKNGEWAYRLHGLGCELIHRVTGEPIQWNFGDLDRFDWHWFADYLKWLLENDPNDEAVFMVSEQLQVTHIEREQLWKLVYSVLEQLHQKGMLSKQSEINYTLIR